MSLVAEHCMDCGELTPEVDGEYVLGVFYCDDCYLNVDMSEDPAPLVRCRGCHKDFMESEVVEKVEGLFCSACAHAIEKRYVDCGAECKFCAEVAA